MAVVHVAVTLANDGTDAVAGMAPFVHAVTLLVPTVPFVHAVTLLVPTVSFVGQVSVPKCVFFFLHEKREYREYWSTHRCSGRCTDRQWTVYRLSY